MSSLHKYQLRMNNGQNNRKNLYSLLVAFLFPILIGGIFAQTTIQESLAQEKSQSQQNYLKSTISSSSQPQSFNFTTFSPIRTYLSDEVKKSNKQHLNHPEYGKLFPVAPYDSLFEVIEKRTSHSKYYVKAGTDGSVFYIQKSNSPMHYKGSKGNLLTYNPKLMPLNDGIFSVEHQPTNFTINTIDEKATFGTKKEGITFNKHLSLIGITADNKREPIATANWSNYSAGDEGMIVKNIFPGIDLIMIVLREKVKTSFIVKKKQPFLENYKKLLILDKAILHGDLQFKNTEGTDASVVIMNDKQEEIFNFGNAFIIYKGARQRKEVSSDNKIENRDLKNSSPLATYKYEDNALQLIVKTDLLKVPSSAYPIIIDPLLSATQTNNIQGQGSGYSCSSPYPNGCVYSLNIPVPAQVTVTDILITSLGYEAMGYFPCYMSDGIIILSLGSCSANLYCNDINPGECYAISASVWSFFSSCVPAPSCNSYNLNFTANYSRCYDNYPGCDNLCIQASRPWTMTVEGRTLETKSVQITAGSTTICAGGSVTLEAEGEFGVPPYTYSWSPGGNGSPINVSPASTTTYNVTISDQCGETATGSVTINVIGPSVDAGPDQTVCTGDLVTLTASGSPAGGTYSWDNGLGTGAVQTFTAASTQTYTVTYTQGGCSAMDQVTVTVADPTIDAGPNQAVCTGNQVTLTATGSPSGGTYSWDNGLGAGAVQTFTATSTQTYTVTYTEGGCAVTDQVTVTVDNPTVDAGPDQTICKGGQVTLTATGSPTGGTYSWDNGLGAGATHNFTETGSKTYTVTYTTGSCSVTDQVIITTVDVSVYAGSDQTACVGDQVTLTATGSPTGGTYSWDNGLGAGAVQTFTATNTQTYTVTYTQGGCSITDQVTVTVMDPTVDAGTDQNVCDGDQVTLTATGSPAGGTYSWDNGLGAGATQNFTASGAGSTTYEVTYTVNGCTTTDNVNVTIEDIPTFTVTTTSPTCGNSDGSITIQGTDPSTNYDLTYEDNGTTVGPTSVTSDANGDIVIPNLPKGSYSDFTIQIASGCSETNTTSVQLSEIGAPSVTAPNDVDICIGESTTLTAGNPSGATISWDNGITDGVAFTPASPGTITYTVTATLNGCTAVDAVDVTVHDLPAINAGNDATICVGNPAIITATGGVSYSWDNSLGAGASHTVSPSTQTTYTVTGTDAFGCVNTDQVVISVQEGITPQFSGDILTGCSPLSVIFTNTTGTTGDVDCLWSFGNGETATGCGSVSHTYETGGTYSVSLTMTTANGCQGTTTLQDYITVTPRPIASFKANPMELQIPNTEVNFINQSLYGQNYTWTFDDDSPTSNLKNPIHSFPDDKQGVYNVKLVVSNGPGCVDSALLVITVNESMIFYIPNSFTPDEDEFNPTFKPIFTSGFDDQTYSLSIYNRWGELIFVSHNTEVGWDGTYGIDSEEIIPSGMYIWKIKIKELRDDKHNVYTGHVMLLR